MRRRALLPALAALLLGAGPAAAPAAGVEYRLVLPPGLEDLTPDLPDDNPLTAERVALGKRLFWDPRGSTSGTVACVTCHRPDHGWSDPRRFSLDAEGRPMPRHTPTIVNRVFGRWQLWTGRHGTLEAQVLYEATRQPDMGAARFAEVPAYREAFRAAFGGEPTAERAAQAIASYVRTILSGNSPYDRFAAGEWAALSPAAQRGLSLFNGGALCVNCHPGPLFTDEAFHNIGVGMTGPRPDRGRYEIYGNEADTGAFKTPALRDVARRGPYMHDGSLPTLEDVVDHYASGGTPNPWLSPQIRPLRLTARNRADLVAFLRALSGQVDPEVSRPPALRD